MNSSSLKSKESRNMDVSPSEISTMKTSKFAYVTHSVAKKLLNSKSSKDDMVDN